MTGTQSSLKGDLEKLQDEEDDVIWIQHHHLIITSYVEKLGLYGVVLIAPITLTPMLIHTQPPIIIFHDSASIRMLVNQKTHSTDRL